jgi:hypothetical protein
MDRNLEKDFPPPYPVKAIFFQETSSLGGIYIAVNEENNSCMKSVFTIKANFPFFYRLLNVLSSQRIASPDFLKPRKR